MVSSGAGAKKADGAESERNGDGADSADGPDGVADAGGATGLASLVLAAKGSIRGCLAWLEISGLPK